MIIKRALNVCSHHERIKIPTQLTTKESSSPEAIFDPFFAWTEESSSAEPISLGAPTKKEQYDYTEELSRLRTDGCAPVKRALYQS